MDKALELENVKLQRLVSEFSLEKLVEKDIASGNFYGNPGRGFGINPELFCANARPGPS